jgi:hypothetical protein
MADNNNQGFWKPWRDGWIENSVKFMGVVMAFLIISGLFDAGYDPVASNPYVWGLQLHRLFTNRN